MVNNSLKALSLLAFAIFLNLHAVSQNNSYKFDVKKQNWSSSVKDQGRTGTCWSYSTISFLESEIKRLKNIEVELSEMFIVRHSYKYRAELFVRYHGHLNFGPGAQSWDAIDVLRKNGIVPREIYSGNLTGAERPNHSEMDRVLSEMVNSVIDVGRSELSPLWMDAIDGTLDAYLGKLPGNFVFQGEDYSPHSFAENMKLDPANYMAVTSFTHHPYHSEFVFESPDNWSNGLLYNLPLDEFIETIDRALLAGHTIAWSSDVSDPGFNHKKGVAIVPSSDFSDMTDDEKKQAFKKPVAQKQITPEMRQKGYDNWATTDDHAMHMVGMAYDQLGTKYYIIKNSWGVNNPYDGYFYASEAYVRLKTMSILINKEFVKKRIP